MFSKCGRNDMLLIKYGMTLTVLFVIGSRLSHNSSSLHDMIQFNSDNQKIEYIVVKLYTPDSKCLSSSGDSLTTSSYISYSIMNICHRSDITIDLNDSGRALRKERKQADRCTELSQCFRLKNRVAYK